MFATNQQSKTPQLATKGKASDPAKAAPAPAPVSNQDAAARMPMPPSPFEGPLKLAMDGMKTMTTSMAPATPTSAPAPEAAPAPIDLAQMPPVPGSAVSGIDLRLAAAQELVTLYEGMANAANSSAQDAVDPELIDFFDEEGREAEESAVDAMATVEALNTVRADLLADGMGMTPSFLPLNNILALRASHHEAKAKAYDHSFTEADRRAYQADDDCARAIDEGQPQAVIDAHAQISATMHAAAGTFFELSVEHSLLAMAYRRAMTITVDEALRPDLLPAAPAPTLTMPTSTSTNVPGMRTAPSQPKIIVFD